ncbi:DUF998 domain-containing protein [Nocardioides speluncae]|uniref:DUF998 domain-containing protein n=1 Tax=Nocardioides speluncae TaxID=2670337 RepID=UPI001F0C18EC|nr:DUF998 domain-containing protein [Nocardioides speluncae]
MTDLESSTGFDHGAAVTRSMLGWGVVAGPFYLSFGLILALTRPGFDLARDALSLLLIGDLGWLQWLNLVLSGLMTIVAAIGLLRTPGWSRRAAALVGMYGLCLVLSAIFPPDPTGKFPPGVGGGEFTAQGVLHLVFGGLGFVCVGVAATLAGSWLGRRWARGALWSRIAGVAIVLTFIAGGALAALPGGVGLIWITVLSTWLWLAIVSIAAYRAIPHPVMARR